MSYPEKKFLNKIKDLGWDKKYLIIREKSLFPYYIDFAFENEKLAVEIDGSQHELEKRKESDKKKDKLLNVIKKIESFILSDKKYEKVDIFKYEKKKYYCSCGNEKSRNTNLIKNHKEK